MGEGLSGSCISNHAARSIPLGGKGFWQELVISVTQARGTQCWCEMGATPQGLLPQPCREGPPGQEPTQTPEPASWAMLL